MLDKIRARRHWRREVALFYHPRYEAASVVKMAQSLGLVALRGKRVLAQLAASSLVKADDLASFGLISLADLRLFHSDSYLAKVSKAETLAHIFGIPAAEIVVDEILSAVRWACGGTLAAARSVLNGAAPLAVNLGGGFHHAEPDMGSGFCVFNDVGIAIRKLREEGFADNIAIIDLDFHQGNGNIIGFLDDPTVATYSLHGSIWTNESGIGDFNLNFVGQMGDDDYLKILSESLPKFLQEHQPGLVFYIAGNDVMEKDLLGEFGLSISGVEQRDRMLFQLLKKLRLPAVVTLGGGYSMQACQASLNLVLVALRFKKPLQFQSKSEFSPAFLKLIAGIDPEDPQFHKEPFSLSEADLFPDLGETRPPGLILGRFGSFELEREMEACGLLGKLRELGWEDFRLSLEVGNSENQKIHIAARSRKGRARLLKTVAEIVLRQELLPAPLPASQGATLPVLLVEKVAPDLDISLELKEFFRRLSAGLQWNGVVWKS